jgi:SAM-dependent methyltransferase
MTTLPQRSDAGPARAASLARDDRDIYRLTPSMDAAVLETIAARLEFRGRDEGYVRLSQAYFPRLPLSGARRLLALGCGTGVEVRALRRLAKPDTTIIGLDQSPALIDAAPTGYSGRGTVRQCRLPGRRRTPDAVRRQRVRHRDAAHPRQPR